MEDWKQKAQLEEVQEIASGKTTDNSLKDLCYKEDSRAEAVAEGIQGLEEKGNEAEKKGTTPGIMFLSWQLKTESSAQETDLAWIGVQKLRKPGEWNDIKF